MAGSETTLCIVEPRYRANTPWGLWSLEIWISYRPLKQRCHFCLAWSFNFIGSCRLVSVSRSLLKSTSIECIQGQQVTDDRNWVRQKPNLVSIFARRILERSSTQQSSSNDNGKWGEKQGNEKDKGRWNAIITRGLWPFRDWRRIIEVVHAWRTRQRHRTGKFVS